MKKYVKPEIEVVEFSANDIITSSLGVESPTVDDNDGVWELIGIS